MHYSTCFIAFYRSSYNHSYSSWKFQIFLHTCVSREGVNTNATIIACTVISGQECINEKWKSILGESILYIIISIFQWCIPQKFCVNTPDVMFHRINSGFSFYVQLYLNISLNAVLVGDTHLARSILWHLNDLVISILYIFTTLHVEVMLPNRAVSRKMLITIEQPNSLCIYSSLDQCTR